MLLFDRPDKSSCTIIGLNWPGHVRDELPECFVSINQSMLQVSGGVMTLLCPASAEPESKLDTVDEEEVDDSKCSEGEEREEQ